MTVLWLLSLFCSGHLSQLEGHRTPSEFSSTLAKMGAADDHGDGESFLRVSLCDEGRFHVFTFFSTASGGED